MMAGATPSTVEDISSELGLTAEVEHLQSRASIPLLSQLVETFAVRFPCGGSRHC